MTALYGFMHASMPQSSIAVTTAQGGSHHHNAKSKGRAKRLRKAMRIDELTELPSKPVDTLPLGRDGVRLSLRPLPLA